MFLFIRICLGITFNKYPLEVIQNQNEQKPINLYNLVGGLENSSFVIRNTSSQIQANLSNTLETLDYIQLDASFCPISEWQPRAQLSHFYLSLNNILMLSGKDQVYFQFEDNCYSIFQYDSQSFGVDCISSEKVDFIQLFNFTLDGVVITGFQPFKSIIYISPYPNCLQRITQQFVIFDSLLPNQLVNQFIQFCSIKGNGQFTIFDENFEEFSIYQNNDLGNCSKIQNLTQIDRVFTNQQSYHRSGETWNLGFTFEKKSGLCKCLYFRKDFTCDYIFLQMFTPSYFRALHSINDNTYIVVGNEKQVYILVLSSSIEEKNSYTVLYKNIYDKYSNQLIDSTITSEFILFTIAYSESQQPAQSYLQLKCLGQNKTQNFINIQVKMYGIQQLSEEIYQSISLPENTLLLSNYENFGVKNQYIQYDHQKQLMTIIQINPKILSIQFTGELQINYQQEMINLTVNYNNHQENSSKASTNITLLVCINNQTDKTPYLIAQTWNEQDNIYQHHVCPFPDDNRTYVKLVNELNLLDGLMGPLLEFNYVPDPNLPVFFPFYIQYNITAQVIDDLFSAIDIIYSAVRVDDVIQYDVYNTIILQVSDYKRESVDILLCNIIESKSYLISNPVNLSIQGCDVFQKFSGPKDVKIDYFEDFVGFQVYGSITNHSFYICNLLKCGKLDLDQNISRIHNTLTQQTGTSLTFTLTIQSSEYELRFYQYSFNPVTINDTIECNLSNVIDSRNYFPNSMILDYKFLYHFEEMLLILFDNYEVVVLTQGEIYPLEGYFINFTRISSTFSCQYCQNQFDIGGIQVLDSHIISQAKQIIIWCTKIDKSHLVQYTLFNPYQVSFYRELPLYNLIIDPTMRLFETSSQLFVGIFTTDPKYRVYYIYDPFDFSPKTLVTYFKFEAKERNIVYPIYAPVKVYNERGGVSMALVISQQIFIYFLNPQAKFYSRYKTSIDQNSLQQEQILLIRIQQYGEAFVKYRQYNLQYILNYTLIETVFGSKLNITPSNQEGFQYQLIIESNQLNGSISSYSLIPKSNKSQVQIQQYVSLDKRVGEYLSSIDAYGEVVDIIDLDNYQYYTLYQADNVSQYANLLVVLTRNSLLFLEKTSFKSSNIFANCESTSDWNRNNSLCNARLIDPQWNGQRFQNQNFVFCHATPNQIFELILICQNRQNKINTNIMYFYVNFTYYQENSTVIINKFKNITNSYLQDLFSDKSLPFMINGTVYQILVHTLFLTNSEVGMFQLEFSDDGVQLVNSQFITNASENGTPYQLIEDFDGSYYFTENRTFILLLLLQETNLVMTFITQDLSQYIGYVYYGADLVEDYQFLGDILNYNFIEILSPNGTFPTLEIALGNKTHIIILNLTLNEILKIESLQLVYTFVQYYECAESLILQGIKRPQFIFNKFKQIEYLIAPCIKKLSNYYGNYEQFIELYGLPSQNQIFLQFFQKQQNQNFSTPIQILQTQTIDILKSNPIMFQTYQSFYQPHLVVSSSTYLLDDFQIRNQTIFQIYTNSTEDEIFYFYANNSEFHFEQKLISKYNSGEPNKDVLAFIILVVVLLICFVLIIGLVVYYYVRHQKKKKNDKLNKNGKTDSQLLINSGGSLEIAEIDKKKQRSESVFILDDAVRQVFASQSTTRKKKRQSNI